MHLLMNVVVPYAWFEKDGPVLYVNRTKWPFPTPFRVTGSDRSDQEIKSLTPRQSAWMPYTRSPDFTSVKGAVLDPSVLSWIGRTPECFQFRVETIKWIQKRLQDPETAVSYSTIGAIMTFTMWTVSDPAPERTPLACCSGTPSHLVTAVGSLGCECGLKLDRRAMETRLR